LARYKFVFVFVFIFVFVFVFVFVFLLITTVNDETLYNWKTYCDLVRSSSVAQRGLPIGVDRCEACGTQPPNRGFVDYSPEDYSPGDVNNADKTKVTTQYCR